MRRTTVRSGSTLDPSRSLVSALALGMVFATVLGVAPCLATQIDDSEGINISLRDADLAMVLESFARVAGGRLEIDGTIEGKVTVELENVPWRKALAGICDQNGLVCRIETDADGTPVLRIDAGSGGSMKASTRSTGAPDAEPIDISLRGADLVETLTTFGRISDMKATVDSTLQGIVTLEVERQPWSEVVEEICRIEGCIVAWNAGGFSIDADPDGGISDQTLNIDLAGASVREVVASVASILKSALGQTAGTGVTVDVDPSLERPIDLSLDGANWQEALDAVCRAAECTWTYVYGDTPGRERVLRLRPANRDVVQRIDLDLGPASFDEVAAALAETIDRQALLLPTVDRDQVVDLDLVDERFLDAVDRLCRAASCRWDLSVDGSVIFGPSVRALASQPPVGTPDRWLHAQIEDPQGGVVARALRFSWIDAVQVIETEARDAALVLSWLPLSSQRQVVVATLIRCADDLPTIESVRTFDLPLRQADSWRVGGWSIEASTAKEADKQATLKADASSSASAAGRPVTQRCVETPRGRIDALLEIDQTTSRLSRIARPGLYWLMTPTSPAEDISATAVVILGSNSHGTMDLLRLTTSNGRDLASERIALLADQPSPYALAGDRGRLELHWTQNPPRPER